jgi:hypothetical protein
VGIHMCVYACRQMCKIIMMCADASVCAWILLLR